MTYNLTGTNTITEKGELYNVDGNGNRMAAFVYGPEKVLVVAGTNKIVRDLDAAIHRIKTVAAPANGKCLKKDTPLCENGTLHLSGLFGYDEGLQQ